MQFRLGFAVWAFKGWEGGFYPVGVRQADTLHLYAERATVVEGNSVFYGIPSAAVMARWVEQTPAHFRFCPKIPRAISHSGPLAPRIAEALSFHDHMRAGLGQRLGPIFLQLPPVYSPLAGPDLARLLNAWRRHTHHPLLVEVRHRDWFAPAVMARLDTLLSRLSLGRVILDTRPIYSGTDDPQRESPNKKPALPVIATAPGPITMVRFISHPDSDRNLRALHEWTGRIHRWLAAGKETYFFMHCPKEQFSPANARIFQRMLEDQGAPVPPLPWDALPPDPSQQGMF